jgi:hypothetical protein
MSNMSYCRFENTYSDLEECLEALQNDGLENLSESELLFAKQLIETCDYISQRYLTQIESL